MPSSPGQTQQFEFLAKNQAAAQQSSEDAVDALAEAVEKSEPTKVASRAGRNRGARLQKMPETTDARYPPIRLSA